MKRIIIFPIILFAMLFSINPVTSYAATNDDVYNELIDMWNYLNNNIGVAVDEVRDKANNLETQVNELNDKVDNLNIQADVKKETTEAMEEYYSDIKSDGEIDKSTIFPRSILSIANSSWDLIGAELKAGSGAENTFGTKYNLIITPDAYTDVQNVIKVFAYSLVLVFFAANLIETTIKYEMFTLKGASMIFGRLIISKFIIDASVKICMAIINEVSKLSTKIIDIGSDKLLQFPNPEIKMAGSDVKIIGPILDTITGFILSIPLTLVFICVLICAVFVLMKLILRSFELAMLVSISPAFFACLSSDLTKQYFRNFITTFIQCAGQIVFMAIVLKVGSQTLTFTPPAINSLKDMGVWLAFIFPYMLIIIAMSIMMVKPPKVLTGLIK